MKTNDNIILYADGQMNEEERVRFEKELESSEELRRELAAYKEFISGIKAFAEIETEPDYFVNMVPRFREINNIRKKYKIIPRLALGFTTISAVVLISILVLTNRTKNINNVISTVPDTVLTDYSLNYSPLSEQMDLNSLTAGNADADSVLSSMLSNELNISVQGYNELMASTSSSGSTDLQSMLQGINSNEANQIYNELLHKRIY